MKYIISLLIVTSCTTAKLIPSNGTENDLVSVQAAIMHAQASYLKGCVDAMKDLKIPLAFHGCRDKSIIHRQELETFMLQDYNIPREE